MLDAFMAFLNVLFIGILALDWRLEGKDEEPIFSTGILRLTLIFLMSLELLERVLNLL